MTPAKTSTERSRKRRAILKQENLQEVRGILADPNDHARIRQLIAGWQRKR